MTLCSGCIGALVLSCMPPAQADTLYLKNGRSLEGVIKKESAGAVELDVGGGTAVFKLNELESMRRSSAQENAALYQKWERRKQENAVIFKELEKERAQNARIAPQHQEKILPRERAPEPTLVYFDRAGATGHITVDARLNDQVSVSLLLDTGATLVVLSAEIGRQLGLDAENAGVPIQMKTADGRLMKAKYVVLQSVRVRDAEVRDVPAAIMTEDNGDTSWKDGILGMSFLKEFNFRVDQEDQKLILEKRVGDEH